jgi:hypothetical protein
VSRQREFVLPNLFIFWCYLAVTGLRPKFLRLKLCDDNSTRASEKEIPLHFISCAAALVVPLLMYYLFYALSRAEMYVNP